MTMKELAEELEDSANMLLKRAERIWSWRKRDRAVSVAIGDTSRTFRKLAAALRAIASQEQSQ